MKINRIAYIFLILCFYSIASFAQKTVVEIKGEQFYINGKPTFEGRSWQGNKIAGLLINSRMVQGIFDDLNPESSGGFAYPDTKIWDAERNTDEFIAAMPIWYENGMNAFTLNMQGGSPYGYGNKKCLNPGFNPDGSLMQPYMNRLDRILKKADELHMVVILGIFYFGQDQHIKDEAGIINATDNLINWLFDKGYRNVIIEIANECDAKAYNHSIIYPERITELINRVKNNQQKGYRFLVSTSFGGCVMPNSNVVKASDFLLIHGNGAKSPKQIQSLIDSTKMVKGYRSMPIVNNEDDHFDFEKDTNNFVVSIKNYVSWGYFDFRFPKETAYSEGYQSVPVDWGVNSERKKAFFKKAKEITGGHKTKEKKQPNIIFILTDDQRWDALGYTGNKLAHTPEMDKLAQSGTYFRKAMVTTPICAASRATILSGMYERAHRYTFQTGAIKDEFMANAYPKILRGAGYYTGFYGKLGVKYDQKKELFDVQEEYDRNGTFTDRRGYFFKKIGKDTVHLTRYTGQKAINFIENAPTDKPFCLSLSFSAPHAHDNAPDQYFWDQETDYWLKDLTIPPADLGEDKYFNAQPEKVKTGFNHLRWTWRFDNPEKYQRMVKGYYRMIAGVDLEIAKIRAELKKKGLDKNTIIIVMGDNGYFLGERHLADKWLMYDQSVRVPLIIYDPRTAIHQETDEMALNVDISATMADLAGVAQPENWHGKSLLPLVSGANKTLNRDTVLIEHLWETKDIPPSEGVRTSDFKYFRYVNDKSWEELYDLKKDPKEINNLAKTSKYKEVLNSLRLKTNNLRLNH